MNKKFEPGAKVVCVDDSDMKHPLLCQADKPKKGKVYVVAEVHTCGAGGLRLVGITAPTWCPDCFGPSGFKISRFRLLDDLKQEARARQTKSQPQHA